MAARPGVQLWPGRALTLISLRNFLSADDCDQLIERIDQQRRPSTIADDLGLYGFRTSETGHLDVSDTIVADINRRIAAFASIDSAHGEPIQGQRYAVGQEFKPHTDYFEPNGLDYDRYCGRSGNRTWTFMVYLNDVAAGGATRFTKIGKTIQPERGKLVGWNNRTEDGALNPASIHHGMKVRQGTKYIITKWYRELPWMG